jgi:beta-lactamase class A
MKPIPISGNILKRQIPIYVTLLLVLFSIVLTYAVIDIKHNLYYTNPAQNDKNDGKEATQSGSNIELIRNNRIKLIQPILIADANKESPNLETLKEGLTSAIDKMKNEGRILNASVYINKLDNGEWTCVNGDKTYRPRSLVKVPILITYLKMAEKDPTVLSRKFYYNAPDSTMPVQSFSTKVIQPGKLYSTKRVAE